MVVIVGSCSSGWVPPGDVSARDRAAVEVEGLGGAERRFLRREVDAEVTDVVRRSGAAHGDLTRHLVTRVAALEPLVAPDQAERDRVGGDAARRLLQRQTTGERHACAL